MNLVDFIQKANLGNVVIIAGLIIGGVTTFNTIELNKAETAGLKTYVASMETRVNKIELSSIEHKHKIASLENNNEKFDKTLNTVNNTLLELNGTIQGLKATVESMK